MCNVLLQAANFVARYEGFVGHEYKCPAGFATFGYGSLVTNHPDVTFPITEDQATVYLEQDLGKAFSTLDAFVHAPININQTVALASFIYNVGSGAFVGSTLLRFLNLLEYSNAADQFLVWTHGGGRVLPGLVARRADERALFLKPVTG